MNRSDCRNWKVVRSQSGKSPEGFPIGEFLFFDEEMVQHAIKDSGMMDPIVTSYLDERPETLNNRGLYEDIASADVCDMRAGHASGVGERPPVV